MSNLLDKLEVMEFSAGGHLCPPGENSITGYNVAISTVKYV